MSLFMTAYLRIPKVQAYVADLNAFLASRQRLPQLYLYGDMDELAPPELIVSAIEQQKKNGVAVQAKSFDYSPHARHMTVHYDTYWSAVDRFLQSVLGTSTSTSANTSTTGTAKS